MRFSPIINELPEIISTCLSLYQPISRLLIELWHIDRQNRCSLKGVICLFKNKCFAHFCVLTALLDFMRIWDKWIFTNEIYELIHRYFCFQMTCHSRKSLITKVSYLLWHKGNEVSGSERVRGRPRSMVWLDICFVLVRTQQQSITATIPIPVPSTDPETKCLKATKKMHIVRVANALQSASVMPNLLLMAFAYTYTETDCEAVATPIICEVMKLWYIHVCSWAEFEFRRLANTLTTSDSRAQ